MGTRFPQIIRGQSALHRAALSGEMEEVDRIVASGADIDPADKEGWSPQISGVRRIAFQAQSAFPKLCGRM